MNTIKKIHAIKSIKDIITAAVKDKTEIETIGLCRKIFDLIKREV